MDLLLHDIRIAARQVSSIGMLIHEMMTNSCKHGALGESTGHVRIDWTVSHDPSTARQHVTMTWTETGGPTPQPGPRRVGLDLVQGLAQAELGGSATIDFPPTGATAHFTFALDPIGAMTPAS